MVSVLGPGTHVIPRRALSLLPPTELPNRQQRRLDGLFNVKMPCSLPEVQPNVKGMQPAKMRNRCLKLGRFHTPKIIQLLAGQQGAQHLSAAPVRRSIADSRQLSHLTGLQATAPRAAGTRPWPGLLAPLTVFTQGHSTVRLQCHVALCTDGTTCFQCRSLFQELIFYDVFPVGYAHLPLLHAGFLLVVDVAGTAL